MSSSWRSLVLPVLLGVLVSPVAAQQPDAGAVTGRVIDLAGTAVANANVVIVGTTRGARTDDQGRFRIPGVAAGTHQVRVSRLGFGAVTRPVTVTAGQDAPLEFRLAPAAVQIDEVVVTATGAAERKREQGNDIGIIRPGEQVNLAAVQTLTQTLSARTPGLTITAHSGTLGTSARIRIRGANSISLNNEPLLIIDGVRIENDANAALVNGVGGSTGGQTINRFDDINPEDIEAIEVLKGPAASALYGTAAANGVIQVTTKRGRSGRTQWRTYAEYGNLWDPTDYPDNLFMLGYSGTTGTTNYTSSCTIDRLTQGLCRAQPNGLVRFNPMTTHSPMERGNQRAFGLSASGGTDLVQYFVSGDLDRAQGIVGPNRNRVASGRANLNAQLRPNLNVAVTTNYVDRQIGLPQNDNNIYGIVPAATLGKAADCRNGTPEPVFTLVCKGDTLSRGFYAVPPQTFWYQEREQLLKKFVGGMMATWQPLSWLTAVGQGGLDLNNSLDAHLTPANVVTYINQVLIEGFREQRRVEDANYTVQGSLSAQRPLPWQEIQSQTVIGAQYINEQRHWTDAFGRNLVPGTASLATAGAGYAVNESNEKVVTVGGYARQQFAWRDRAFLTGTIRADDNSAFGQDFELAYYPGLSASWVISEEPFFRGLSLIENNWVNQLRLRAAYGQSGQRPGFRQADTFLSGVAVTDTRNQELTAVVIGGTGNTKLKPETSAETELGFDASFIRNRLGVTYTYFNKVTTDQLVAKTLAPSLGVATTAFLNGTTQFFNLGEGTNRGHELTLDVNAVDTRAVKLTLTLSGSTLKNEIKDLGQDAEGKDLPPVIFNAAAQRHQKGYAAGAWFQRKYTYADKNNDGVLSRVNCVDPFRLFTPVLVTGAGECEVVLGDTASAAQFIGNVLPTRELSFAPTLTLFDRVRLTALVNYRGGHYVFNNTEEFRCTSSSFLNCAGSNDPTAAFEDQAAALGRLMGTSYGYIEKGDFTKLREVALTLMAPPAWARRAGVQTLNLTIAGRNLAKWTDYKGFDPEVNSSTANFTQFDFLAQPALRSWTTRIDVTF
jgi:TonB-linked SusC/RagA family outer membrane protein